MASDKQMEKAREIIERVAKVHVWRGDAEIDIATALANAEREGMKRAAEIARKHFDLRHADKARFASMAIAAAILSEAKESE